MPPGSVKAPGDALWNEIRPAVRRRQSHPEGHHYERVLYGVSSPYHPADFHTIAAFMREPPEALSPSVLRVRLDLPFPDLARERPLPCSTRLWSAILHFHDPSYPLYSPAARRALNGLGFSLPAADLYPAYVRALDRLKEACPATSVPETNWFLSRILQVALEDWSQRGCTGFDPPADSRPQRS